jgi:hypothetical protein
MIKKKLSGTEKNDPEWIRDIAEGLLDINLDELSDSQKKMLREQYIANIRDGLKSKDAIQKAVQIVSCFK